jgi:hypothetical protein
MRDQKSLERERLYVVVATVVINVVVVALLAFAPWSDWKTGLGLNLLDNLILFSFICLRRDALLGRFILFGLALGFVELAADAWLVDYTRTLDYSIGGGPMLWRSPLWMPFAWEIVAVQFSYIGLRLTELFGGLGLATIGFLGAINIPYYEEMARRINWWQYRNCVMISNTPYYIILGETAIAIALSILARPLRRGGAGTAVFMGVVGGAAILVAYAIAYVVMDVFVRRI